MTKIIYKTLYTGTQYICVLGIFEQCSKWAIQAFSSSFHGFLLKIARKLLEKETLLKIARIIKKCSKSQRALNINPFLIKNIRLIFN